MNIKDATPETIFSAGTNKDLLAYDMSGGRVYIRKISNLTFRQWAKRNEGSDDDLYNDASLIQLCVCKRDGSALFTLEQIPRIAKMDQEIVIDLANACAEYNGVGKKAAAKIAKNSETIPTKDS